ncbi:hypothetical protein BT96DRAFT_976785 [Gymnopus androsaceus JB14]|uniref:Uncharacterized protein n=1 Tax=Gymnopus androsaceus JB14 TaxID=1447944 RepID=A0A6A4HLM8_9AGAR|nr:hypothetical protein BT96DRAFT_976785 [Gymnopus androsaceus JB14]
MHMADRIARYVTRWRHASQKARPGFYTNLEVKFPQLPPADVNQEYAGRISLQIVESSEWTMSTGHLRIVFGGNADFIQQKSSHPLEGVWQNQETKGAGIAAQFSISPNVTFTANTTSTTSVSRPAGTVSTAVVATPDECKGVAYELIPFRYPSYSTLHVNEAASYQNFEARQQARAPDFPPSQRPDEKKSDAEIHMLCGSLAIDNIYAFKTTKSSCKTSYGKATQTHLQRFPTKDNKGLPATNNLLFRVGSAIFPKDKLSRFLRKTPSGTPLMLVNVVLFEWNDGGVVYEDLAQTSHVQSYFPERFAGGRFA